MAKESWKSCVYVFLYGLESEHRKAYCLVWGASHSHATNLA